MITATMGAGTGGELFLEAMKGESSAYQFELLARG
jgi:hypothetical protein